MVYAWKEMEEMKWGRSMAPAALWLVSARMQQGSSIAVMVGECGDGARKEHCRGCWRSGGGVAVEGECGDGAAKEHCRGCWRSGDGVAVDGECGDGAWKEHCRGGWS